VRRSPPPRAGRWRAARARWRRSRPTPGTRGPARRTVRGSGPRPIGSARRGRSRTRGRRWRPRSPRARLGGSSPRCPRQSRAWHSLRRELSLQRAVADPSARLTASPWRRGGAEWLVDDPGRSPISLYVSGSPTSLSHCSACERARWAASRARLAARSSAAASSICPDRSRLLACWSASSADLSSVLASCVRSPEACFAPCRVCLTTSSEARSLPRAGSGSSRSAHRRSSSAPRRS